MDLFSTHIARPVNEAQLQTSRAALGVRFSRTTTTCEIGYPYIGEVSIPWGFINISNDFVEVFSKIGGRTFITANHITWDPAAVE